MVEKNSPQDKFLNHQILNTLSTEQMQKIVDIIQMNNDKGKTSNLATDVKLIKNSGFLIPEPLIM